jgi:hypothetical protein
VDYEPTQLLPYYNYKLISLIDVTTTSAPKLPLPDTPVNLYKPYAAQAQKVYSWTSSPDPNFKDDDTEQQTANLNQVNLTLIPFSINPYGSQRLLDMPIDIPDSVRRATVILPPMRTPQFNSYRLLFFTHHQWPPLPNLRCMSDETTNQFYLRNFSHKKCDQNICL